MNPTFFFSFFYQINYNKNTNHYCNISSKLYDKFIGVTCLIFSWVNISVISGSINKYACMNSNFVVIYNVILGIFELLYMDYPLLLVSKVNVRCQLRYFMGTFWIFQAHNEN